WRRPSPRPLHPQRRLGTSHSLLHVSGGCLRHSVAEEEEHALGEPRVKAKDETSHEHEREEHDDGVLDDLFAVRPGDLGELVADLAGELDDATRKARSRSAACPSGASSGASGRTAGRGRPPATTGG